MGLVPIFVSKVLLEPSHVYSLTYDLKPFSHYSARGEYLQRDYENIYYLAFKNKTFADLQSRASDLVMVSNTRYRNKPF